MEKVKFHNLVMLQVKVVYCLLTALGLSVIAALDLLEDKKHFAIIAASFSLLLVLYAAYMLVRRRKGSSPYPEWILVGLLLVFTLFGMHQRPEVAHWTYLVPVYTYFLFPFRTASYITLAYSLALVILVLDDFDSFTRLQVLFTYAACYAFSVMYALINERTNHALTEIVNTDPLTQVYNEHQLYLDLNKEMTRADRQRSSMTVLAIATPADWHALKEEDYEQRLGYLGRKLRQCLRSFDACYRLNTDDFVILMPDSDEDDARGLTQALEQLLLDNRHPELRSLLVHAESYRPDDDAQALIARVRGGLYAA
ncbi:GGDEF domain-containing protein [Thalassolituus marinus]|jgi:GGDEF domain-containing protein|uniref:diguanylate cyclase n=1 Tax=Thalassolituus marinus TaxID=671053 RepID=A0ABS7ZJW8_9GAMM|nr:diguanylate cyclase [Thalassolituus marinus]MCA6062009.1 diguanylate cyclase [Thalassolituus marinus]